MDKLPTIRSYGEYSSSNYGVNSLQVSFPSGFTLYYSYDTIVAFRGSDGLKVRQNEWNTTTGKHLNWIDGGDKKGRLDGVVFVELLVKELMKHGLTE